MQYKGIFWYFLKGFYQIEEFLKEFPDGNSHSAVGAESS